MGWVEAEGASNAFVYVLGVVKSDSPVIIRAATVRRPRLRKIDNTSMMCNAPVRMEVWARRAAGIVGTERMIRRQWRRGTRSGGAADKRSIRWDRGQRLEWWRGRRRQTSVRKRKGWAEVEGLGACRLSISKGG